MWKRRPNHCVCEGEFWTLPPGSALPKRQPSLRCWDAVTAAFTGPGLSKKKSKKTCLTFWECFWQPYKFQSFIENSNPNSQLKIYENSSFVQSKSSSLTIPDRNCGHTNVRGGGVCRTSKAPACPPTWTVV